MINFLRVNKLKTEVIGIYCAFFISSFVYGSVLIGWSTAHEMRHRGVHAYIFVYRGAYSVLGWETETGHLVTVQLTWHTIQKGTTCGIKLCRNTMSNGKALTICTLSQALSIKIFDIVSQIVATATNNTQSADYTTPKTGFLEVPETIHLAKVLDSPIVHLILFVFSVHVHMAGVTSWIYSSLVRL